MIEAACRNFDEWRDAARQALAANTAPESINFTTEPSLLAGPLPAAVGRQPRAPAAGPQPRAPRSFVELARTVAMHRDPRRWNLLYRVLWRITHGERDLLKVEFDDDVAALRRMEKAVKHEIHRVHAFVRFRQAGEGRFVAWLETSHDVLEAAAPFFARRFAAMKWAILTPIRSAVWDGSELVFGPGVPRSEAPPADDLEDLWRDYYSSIFNPARLNVATMRAHMPARYWGIMPETELLPGLIHQAEERVDQMQRNQPSTAAPFVPTTRSLTVLAGASKDCRGCDLYKYATQTVFGEGPKDARVILIGEQPGDQEDLAGHPFVGPAGKMLDRALDDAEVDRRLVYVTNAVKHFKFEARGKRRIHSKPTGVEINACRPWLEAELALIQPELVVCLGATAAQSIMGRAFRVTQSRGVILPHPQAKQVMATVHPSSLLRVPEPERRKAEYEAFVSDLRVIRQAVG